MVVHPRDAVIRIFLSALISLCINHEIQKLIFLNVSSLRLNRKELAVSARSVMNAPQPLNGV